MAKLIVHRHGKDTCYDSVTYQATGDEACAGMCWFVPDNELVEHLKRISYKEAARSVEGE